MRFSIQGLSVYARRLLMSSVVSAVAVLFIAFHVPVSSAQTTRINGEWETTLGPLSIEQTDTDIRGTFGEGGTISGTIDGLELKGEYRYTDDGGDYRITVSDSADVFAGTRRNARGGTETFRGWRSDPNAADAANADFSGYWLSSMGTMFVEQNDDKVTGTFMAARWGSFEGTVTGRTMSFDWRKFHFTGKCELEMSANGSQIFGRTLGDDSFAWYGLKPEGFEHHVEASPGEIVKGIADNGMLYHLRMPEDWTPGEPVDVVVLLHGSNFTTAGMVFVTNKNWPDLGRKFAILGIQGEQWATWSGNDDLRFNYSYINWVGRSVHGGFPGTERESPFLVANILDEMKEKYGFGRAFIGGHSQGGYLAYMMHMHYPEKIAGSFPIAGGMIFQAEPDAFDDEALIESQQDTPMAIIHGRRDNVVDISSSHYAHKQYQMHDFSKVKMLTPNGGHAYDFLPVNEAIEYLDMMSTENGSELVAYASEQVEKRNWREVGLTIQRAMKIDAGESFAPIWEQYEAAATEDAAKHLRKIERNANGRWVEEFLKYRSKFSTAVAARELMSAFDDLREAHNEDAEPLYEEAMEARNSGDRAKANQNFKTIVEQYYASMFYPSAKDFLER